MHGPKLTCACCRWVQLLGSLPEYVERYDTGFSELRFSIREPQESEEESSTDEEEEARIEALRQDRLERAYQKVRLLGRLMRLNCSAVELLTC